MEKTQTEGGVIAMDIAAMAMNMSNMKVQQQASMAVMKMAMDTATMQSNDIAQLLQSSAQVVDANVRAMEQSVNPHLGANIDMLL